MRRCEIDPELPLAKARRARRLLEAGILVTGLAAFGCLSSACSRKGAPAARGDGARPPVPAPEGLLGEIIIGHPDQIWETVRTDLGGGSRLLPRSAPLFVGSLLGLPSRAFDQIDLNLPVLGSVSEGTSGTDVLMAIHVKDGERMADMVCDGKPPQCKKADAGSGVTLLDPEAGAAQPFSLAISGNYLCAATNREALPRFAPFVTRTLSTRPLPREAATLTLPRSALSGPIAGEVKRAWTSFKKDREADDLAMRAKHGGSAPDFGDPAEALADIDSKVASIAAILGDLDEARLTIATEGVPPEVRIQVTMTPAPGGGPASQELAAMTAGGADPVLALPSSTAFALFTRDSSEMRMRSAKEQSEAVARVLGGRLAAGDRAKIDEALQSWAGGRGDWLTMGVLAGASGRAAVVRASVADAELLGRGASQILSLLTIPSIQEPLANWVGELKMSPAVSTPSAAPSVVHVVHRPSKVQLRKGAGARANETDTFDVVWAVNPKNLVGTAGADAKRLFGSLTEGSSGRTLGDDPSAKAIVASLGTNVSFLVLADAAQLLGGAAPGGRMPQTLCLLAYGKTDADPKGGRDKGWLRLSVPSFLVAEYAKGWSAGRPLDPQAP
jgi:hypothetical protein